MGRGRPRSRQVGGVEVGGQAVRVELLRVGDGGVLAARCAAELSRAMDGAAGVCAHGHLTPLDAVGQLALVQVVANYPKARMPSRVLSLMT